MLPLLRVLPVGSLLLAALIFLLAATPPRRPVLPDVLGPARGPLIDAAEHPEWRQFYLQAAFSRAEELDHLRELPNTPTRMPVVTPPDPAIEKIESTAIAPPEQPVPPSPAKAQEIAPAAPAPAVAEPPAAETPPQKIAGLPTEPDVAESDDITGALDSPAVTATIPVEIGETSSTELPVVLPRERPVRTPPVRPKAGSRAKPQHKAVRPSKPKRPATAAAKQQARPATQFNLFQSHFGATGE